MAILELLGVAVAIKASIIGGIAYKTRKSIKNGKTKTDEDIKNNPPNSNNTAELKQDGRF